MPEIEEVRDNKLVIATGMQGIGKSFLTFTDELLRRAFGNVQHKRKSLIFETNPGEYSEVVVGTTKHRIQTLDHNQIINYSNFKGADIRRICPVRPDGSHMNRDELKILAIKVMSEYFGGTFLLEDFNKAFRTLPDDLIAYLINLRHRMVDTIAHLQSCGKLSPSLLENSQQIRYHYQLDSVAKSASKLEGEEEIFYLAEALVKTLRQRGVTYEAYCYIDRVKKKITGKFSKKDFTVSIQSYLLSNPKEVKNITLQTDFSGKKMYSYPEAVNLKTIELFKSYYGNSDYINIAG
jgi:hypothetical protein